MKNIFEEINEFSSEKIALFSFGKFCYGEFNPSMQHDQQLH